MEEDILKKLFYLPEGNMKDPLNYSGTPFYLGLNLQKEAKKNNIEFIQIDMDFIINVEDIWNFANKMLSKIENDTFRIVLTPVQKMFLPNHILIEGIKKSNSYEEVLNVVKIYDYQVSEYVTSLLLKEYQEGDYILSLNPYNPLFKRTFKYFLYLDTSLFDFYFINRNGFLSFIDNDKVHGYYYSLEKEAVENAQAIYTFSLACKKQLSQLYSTPLTKVVYAGINLKKVSETYISRSSDCFSFLFIGRDFELKGGNLVLEAFQNLNITNTKLTIITNNETAKSLISKNNERINILGIQSKENVLQLYKKHHVLLFPTNIDAFGLVCCEAMYFGLIVIGTNYFAVPEIIGTEDSNLLIKYDANDLKRAMEYTYSEYDNLTELIMNNRKKAVELFNWETVCNKIIKGMIDFDG